MKCEVCGNPQVSMGQGTTAMGATRWRCLAHPFTENSLPVDHLTIRDRIAMSALNGLLSSPMAVKPKAVNTKASWARIAYQWADAMLAARKVQP